jgi:hypothetical protein
VRELPGALVGALGRHAAEQRERLGAAGSGFGVTPIQICLAWAAGRRSALIADFADAVAPTTRDAASSGQTA